MPDGDIAIKNQSAYKTVPCGGDGQMNYGCLAPKNFDEIKNDWRALINSKNTSDRDKTTINTTELRAILSEVNGSPEEIQSIIKQSKKGKVISNNWLIDNFAKAQWQDLNMSLSRSFSQAVKNAEKSFKNDTKSETVTGRVDDTVGALISGPPGSMISPGIIPGPYEDLDLLITNRGQEITASDLVIYAGHYSKEGRRLEHEMVKTNDKTIRASLFAQLEKTKLNSHEQKEFLSELMLKLPVWVGYQVFEGLNKLVDNLQEADGSIEAGRLGRKTFAYLSEFNPKPPCP